MLNNHQSHRPFPDHWLDSMQVAARFGGRSPLSKSVEFVSKGYRFKSRPRSGQAHPPTADHRFCLRPNGADGAARTVEHEVNYIPRAGPLIACRHPNRRSNPLIKS
jgi:hypothetical protein